MLFLSQEEHLEQGLHHYTSVKETLGLLTLSFPPSIAVPPLSCSSPFGDKKPLAFQVRAKKVLRVRVTRLSTVLIVGRDLFFPTYAAVCEKEIGISS